MGAIAMTGQGGDWPVADGVLDLGDLPVERGGVIADARLAWQSRGTLNDARSDTDLYFRVADNQEEFSHLRDGALEAIPSIWGHRAGSPEGIPADLESLTGHVRAWLDR